MNQYHRWLVVNGRSGEKQALVNTIKIRETALLTSAESQSLC